jgi:quinolinate synthase
MGRHLLILGHHYQRSAVLRHADETGDSLELSKKAAAHAQAEKIVFCGVKFMAESADILTDKHQTVFMPETTAGCPMADMADLETVMDAWAALRKSGGDWLPVVYVNSSAEIKAFCGKHGGSTCTSSNAARVFEWALEAGKRVFFLPDEHLGANTARDLGIPDGDVGIYDPRRVDGGLSPDRLAALKIVVWKGFCIVHLAFSAGHVARVRESLPDAKIIVHPEVPRDVVALADAHGSTSQIIDYVERAPDGATIVIGTEVNLVERLAEKHAGRVNIKALSPSVCANMAKTSEQSLLQVLREWPPEREVHVAPDVVADAQKALSRMLRL